MAGMAKGGRAPRVSRASAAWKDGESHAADPHDFLGIVEDRRTHRDLLDKANRKRRPLASDALAGDQIAYAVTFAGQIIALRSNAPGISQHLCDVKLLFLNQ